MRTRRIPGGWVDRRLRQTQAIPAMPPVQRFCLCHGRCADWPVGCGCGQTVATLWIQTHGPCVDLRESARGGNSCRRISVSQSTTIQAGETVKILNAEFCWKNKKGLAFAKPFLYLAPRPGLEPGTCGLTVRRSTDWAIGDPLNNRTHFNFLSKTCFGYCIRNFNRAENLLLDLFKKLQYPVSSERIANLRIFKRKNPR